MNEWMNEWIMNKWINERNEWMNKSTMEKWNFHFSLDELLILKT